tara:strand:+ start:201042 stop:201878 length:837 start_codon:yes stop_codon:yes gene_type:complete
MVPTSIRCQSLSLDFASGVRAVDAVDLHVHPGEITCLIGPSGCGKTSLLRLMAGLQLPSDGSVDLDPPADARRGDVGFVFQQPSLLPWRTAIENVMLPLELIGNDSSSERKQRAAAALHAVRMDDAMDRLPNQLSGGMKMRVSIARTLVTDPKVLLLDEPFAALDDMLRAELGQLLLDVWDRRNFTAVMVTHNIAEATLLSNHIAVMHQGRVITVIENPLPGPRDETLRRSPEFGAFYGRVSDALHIASSQRSPSLHHGNAHGQLGPHGTVRSEGTGR